LSQVTEEKTIQAVVALVVSSETNFAKKSFQQLWASLKGQGASVGELLASQTSTEFSPQALNHFTDPKKSEEA